MNAIFSHTWLNTQDNMAASAATCGCITTNFFRPSPSTPPTQKFPSLIKQFVDATAYSNLSVSISQLKISSPYTINKALITRSVSLPETPMVVEEGEDEGESGTRTVTGCPSCGKEEIENGCNGEGRLQGGIATVPGFGWWPIKAYRPCPSFVASGGRYRRSGQSMDEVVSGSGSKGMVKGTREIAESSKKQQKKGKT